MGKINPFLEERIPKMPHSTHKFIVEAKPGERDTVGAKLSSIPGVKVERRVADNYLVVDAPMEAVPIIEQVPGVEKISADTSMYIRQPATAFKVPPDFKPSSNMGRLDMTNLPIPKILTKMDEWLGPVSLSSVEIQYGPAEGLFALPMLAIQSAQQTALTTEKIRQYIGAPDDTTVNVKVAVADTGLTFPNVLMPPFINVQRKSATGEPALLGDGQGHGTHCHSTAFGSAGTHPRYGSCRGIAQAKEQLHVKVLSNVGFGMTADIIEGIDMAHKWGAKVLSLSLGGPLQGSALTDDPVCRMIDSVSNDMICVIAAGNEGTEWSIGSPGAAVTAITVGSWGLKRNALAGFSSIGPSGAFYRDNLPIWRRDLVKAGNNLSKPDVVAPGGDNLAQEKQVSSCSGWYGPIADLLPGWGLMHGTSQATPVVAGAIAILLDRGIISTANDFKRIMSKGWTEKSPKVGFGIFHFSKFGL